MKNKGFTLAELLGVIIILGLVVVAIAVPLLSQINSTSSSLNDATKELLYEDAHLFMSRHSNTYKKTNGSVYYITLEQLKNSGLLDDDYSISNEDMQIRVVVSDGKYNYQIPNIQLDSIKDKYDSLTISSTYNYAGGTYIKGSYNQNYVKYNGFMWRIMGVNSDGSIRLIMDEPVTTLIYYNNADYEASYVRNWLNNYFVSRLQFNDILKRTKWYYNAPSSYGNTTINSSVYVEDKVGLLSMEEVYLSLVNNNSYLKDKCMGLLNQSNSKFYSTCGTNNVLTVDTSIYPLSVVPVINVFGSTIVSSGDGTASNPFILAEYENNKSGLTLEAANLSIGSSLIINSKTYRIVETNEDNIKIVYRDVPTEFGKYANANSTFNLSNGAGLTLNNAKLPIFLKSNIFLGKIYGMKSDFRNTVFSKSNIIYDVYSSLPVLGEVLTTPLNGIDCYWTLNMATSTEAYRVCGTGKAVKTSVGTYNASSSSSYSLINTAYIPLDTVIASGTKNAGYTIGS